LQPLAQIDRIGRLHHLAGNLHRVEKVGCGIAIAADPNVIGIR